MFYIDKLVASTRREQVVFIYLPTLLVLIILLSITLVLTQGARETAKNEQRQILLQQNTDTIAQFNNRMNIYEDILRGGIGMFNSSEEVTREEWKSYVDSFEIPRRYPGIQAVGYAQLIPKSQLQQHIQSIRNDGFPSYSITPSYDRELYTSIVYIEPFSDMNLRAFGYDMYSEPVRRQAMDKARDSGTAAMSDLVTLVQEDDPTAAQSGFLIFLPLYQGASNTEQSRRENIYGYVYAPFRTKDLLGNLTDAESTEYGFKVERTTDTPYLLFETDNYQRISSAIDSDQESRDIELYGIGLRFTGAVSKNIVNMELRSLHISLFVTGFLFSVMMAAIVYMLLINRINALSKRESEKVQEAKDELLALASHQLRTPATGVKQYIGMLKDELAGPLTRMQKDLIDKAYDSNERQLDTINEMLYVARADSGQLNVTLKPMNLCQTVRSVVNGLEGEIHSRSQTIRVILPTEDVEIIGDMQYLRMALENVISNASKYTPDNGRISVAVKRYGKNRAQVVIKDNGVGIAKNDQRLLFKKFSRIPNELTNKVVGSGIGLYLVRKIIDEHKGTISVTSKEHEGTEVRIILPRKPRRKQSS